MKNVLVTGGCGFIGSNFIRYLLDETDFSGRIINVDALTYAGNPDNLVDVAERFGDRYVFCREDIGDRDAMDVLFRTYDVDGVCHLAAESHVDRSIYGPADFVNTNIMGTFTLLELCRERIGSIELFHQVGTDEVFGSLGAEGHFSEHTPYAPNSPYAASKASADHLVRAYHKTYDLPVTISNCSNNYGPYQFPEKLIPLMILNTLAEKPLPVYGDGLHVRDWLYVRDHCAAVWAIMQHGVRGEVYTVGGRSEWTNMALVERIVDLVAQQMGREPRRDLIAFVEDRPGHDRRYAIDCGKIETVLGWKPEETFESGLEKTVAWYCDHKVWVDRIQSGEYRVWVAKHYGPSTIEKEGV